MRYEAEKLHIVVGVEDWMNFQHKYQIRVATNTLLQLLNFPEKIDKIT